ncbi:metallophosphoesterase family protein [Altererythrobacter sp. B11]|uniref:metallophosphoesterase family protein n=1 Tax=Altererythrobacter sp. B11 TaxID=2060312 RepID=UPI000E5B667F|nr:metallophosphoesterase family protein [Altererythrobacter sp. B11]
MFQSLRHFFSRRSRVLPGEAARVPEGERVYAIGDIHGRLDLFEALIAAVEEDDAAGAPAETQVVLLGDLVDRGPDSAGVIARARDWQRRANVRILGGNHEEMFLRSFDDTETLRHFLRFGGRETLLSFGVSPRRLADAEPEEAQELMRRAVPQDVRDFIAGFEEMIAIGDYLFVHAGIEPGLPLEEQDPRALRWIREPFLSHGESHGAVVVHGHTITEAPDDRGNRIGIDTGAYASGRLTALVLEGDQRRFIETVERDGQITTAALIV